MWIAVWIAVWIAMNRGFTGNGKVLSQSDSQLLFLLTTLTPSTVQANLCYWLRHPIWHFTAGWYDGYRVPTDKSMCVLALLSCSCVLLLFNVINYSGFLKSVFFHVSF